MHLLDITFDFSKINDIALIIAAVGYVIVFAALVVFYLVFSNLPKFLNIKLRARLKREGKECAHEDLNIPGEVNAAISAALFLFFNELHDEESGAMTIKKTSKTYSPWSSKIYGLRQQPHRKY